MRCLALFSGGLDSQIAVRLMQRQGIEVIGVFFSLEFDPPANLAAAMRAAEQLQISLEVSNSFKLLPLVQRPRFGFAQELAPCLDCRSQMVKRVYELLESRVASFIISGEVVGQRPSSLRSRDLEMIAHHGNAEDLLLRPLSAQLLPPTLPERNCWVDRSQLFGWHGRGRKEQLALAKEWNLEGQPGQQPGCMLLEPTYAARLRQTLAQRTAPTIVELQFLSFGRHFWSHNAHLVIGKNHDESEALRTVALLDTEHAVLLEPDNFRGPAAVVFGSRDEMSLRAAALVIGQFSKPAAADSEERWLNVTGLSNLRICVPRQADIQPADQFFGLND